MPIYEFQCDRCGSVVEVLQRASDPAPGDCPSGDGGALSRLLSVHNVGAASPGFEASSCERSPAPNCGQCGMAGTGCS